MKAKEREKVIRLFNTLCDINFCMKKKFKRTSLLRLNATKVAIVAQYFSAEHEHTAKHNFVCLNLHGR